MGWSSANAIFDRVAGTMLELRIAASDCTRVLEELIASLQEGDWDTEDESLESFRDEPCVVEAFARRGIARDEGDEQ